MRLVVLNGVVAVQTNQNCGPGQLLNAMKISVGNVTMCEARDYHQLGVGFLFGVHQMYWRIVQYRTVIEHIL